MRIAVGLFAVFLTCALATEAVGLNASIAECSAAMNGKLPGYYPSTFHFSGNIRRYYIQSEIEEWDYTPSGWDNWLGVPANDSFRMKSGGFVQTNETVGTKYDKAVYRGYTDATFSKRTERQQWEGLQGPIIRAEVGDVIEILFKNKIDGYMANIHSMGMFYSKEYEGSVYYNQTGNMSPGDAVPYDGCFVYKWLITDDLGPPKGEASRLLGYHGFVSMPQDTNSGLFGSNIVYARGQMEKTMKENREFVVGYLMLDEKQSMLAAHNVKKYLPEYYEKNVDPHHEWEYPGMNWTYWNPQAMNDPNCKSVSDACGTFYSLNGYSFSNNPPFDMCVDDNVIWYVYNLGDAPHSAHWHGNNVQSPLANGMGVPTVGLQPGEYMTLKMTAANPGDWMLLCHYTVHFMGLEGMYSVYPKSSCPMKPLSKNKYKRFF